MTDIDWNEIVELMLRIAQWLDATYRFSPFAAGSLAKMIRRAVTLIDRERPQMAIRSIRFGRLNIEWIN